jgi:hypothetical protein
MLGGSGESRIGKEVTLPRHKEFKTLFPSAFAPNQIPIPSPPHAPYFSSSWGMFICHSLSTAASWECDRSTAICLQNFDILEWRREGTKMV